MLTFKVLSSLLSYPEAEMIDALADMSEVIEQERLLTAEAQSAVSLLLKELAELDLIEAQERYVSLFDRGRFVSLHLFEHVHGESRDRGQAMVELMNEYARHGFQVDAHELPDYLPMLLEFLAYRPIDEAKALLSDAMPVVSLLGARLRERDSPYQAIFSALESFAGLPADIHGIRQRASEEGPDETLVKMDEIWEEEAVSFMATDSASCKGSEPFASGEPAATTVLKWIEPPPARSGDQ